MSLNSMDENKMAALIMKLSRENLEVHNVDQTIWTIRSSLPDYREAGNGSIVENLFESNGEGSIYFV